MPPRTPQPSQGSPKPARPARSRTSTDELDDLTDAFITAARALVALAVRSINASPIEVTLMQHRVLVLLASRGEQTVGALAEQLGVNASNASRVCDRLQRQGLLSRRRSTADARSVKVALTTEGMQVLHAVAEHRRGEVRRILGSVTPPVARGTVEALRTFNEAAHEVAAGDWVVPERTDAPEPDVAVPPRKRR